MTQQEVADYLSINRTTYTKYETGVTEPSITTINKLAELFSVDVSTLIGNRAGEKLDESTAWQLPLSKQEQNLISTFRKLDAANQKKALSLINQMLHKGKPGDSE